MTTAPARKLALKVLARVRKDGAFSGAVLAAAQARARLSAGDAALATRLVYGTLAAQGVLDEAIARHARGALEPLVRDALRVAAFELLFGRAPAYAVVDQAVSSVRAVRPQAAGLANAVLRRLAGEAASFPWGDPASDRDALARATAHPRWIVDLLLEQFGDERGREMLSSGLEASPTYIRLDPFAAPTKVTESALAAASLAPSPPDQHTRLVAAPHVLYAGDEVIPGWFAMDAAAQLAPAALAPMRDEDVCDVGAGRGNKTLCLQAMAVRTGGPARIVALDIHAGKAAALRRRLDAAQVPAVDVLSWEGTDLAGRFGADAFDAVMVDAPCTGLGTLRRYPEKRWRLQPGDVQEMTVLQKALLTAAMSVVRPGGRVVYSTCSVAAPENDGVVDAALAEPTGRQFGIEPLGDRISPDWGHFRDARGCFQSWPTSGGPDGHYVAVLRRSRDTQ